MGSKRTTYHTDPASSIAALAFGAMVGGALLPLFFLASSMLFDDSGIAAPLIHLSVYVFIIASFVWLFGLTFLAAPIWLILHLRNLRDARVAVLLGASLCFLIGFVYRSALFGILSDGRSESYDGRSIFVGRRLTLYGWQSATEAGLFLAIQGAIVGFAVWRWAYRRHAS